MLIKYLASYSYY